jgi:hypothetical protein
VTNSAPGGARDDAQMCRAIGPQGQLCTYDAGHLADSHGRYVQGRLVAEWPRDIAADRYDRPDGTAPRRGPAGAYTGQATFMVVTWVTGAGTFGLPDGQDAVAVMSIAPALTTQVARAQANGRVHDLKTWPRQFHAVMVGQKRHEVRRDDRGGYLVGDVLHLQEWAPAAGEP